MKFRLLVLLSSLLLISPALAFQDDDAEALDDLGDSRKGAYLNVSYDQQGNATINLSLGSQPRSWEGIQTALASAFNCPPGAVSHPDSSTLSPRYLSRLSAGERRRQLKMLEQENALQVQGHCPGSAHRSGLIFSSTLATNKLVHELQAAGSTGLQVWIGLPDVPYSEFTGAREPSQAVNPLFVKFAKQSKHVEIPITPETMGPDLQIAFGWSREVVVRIFIRMFVFLLLPIAVVLRVRSLSLRTFKDDPTGAWFAFMKTLGWCTNGGMLLWYLTNLGARLDLEKLVNFVFPAARTMAIAVHLAIYFLPAALIYLSCIAVSHRVFVEVKKAQYTWPQFLAEHSLTLAQTIVPIACFGAALRLHLGSKLFVVLLFLAYASALFIRRSRMKLTKNYPTIALAGELRDRVFEFATRLGVKLQHVVILPAQRTQVANAFASPTNTVIFTDFLLQRMSKREVDAIAGHELTHLKCSHPAKLTLAMLAACFAPLWMLGFLGAMSGAAYGLMLIAAVAIPPAILSGIYRSVSLMSDWGIDGLITVIVGFAGVYALSRHFERQADAGAVAVTKDPEAMITALLKLGSLNLTPLDWGKGTGASLTHPSTRKRIQRIADGAGISNARLEEMIAQFSVDKLSHQDIATLAEQHREGEHYDSQTGDAEASHKVVSRSQNLLFALIALLVIPPALIEFAVEHLQIAGQLRTLVYAAGVVLSVVFYFLSVKMLSLRGLSQQKTSSRKSAEVGGFKIKELQSCLVGFAPGSAPRIYLGTYNFDTGLLLLSKDRLVYLGNQLKFSLTRKQVISIQTGPGNPGWWSQERIYVRWQDETAAGVFNFSAQEPCSLWGLDARVRKLYSQLLTWRLRGQPQEIPAGAEALQPPRIGEVTCKTPRETLSLKVQFSVLVLAGLAIWGASKVMGIHSGYLWLTVIVLRIFETIPSLFYREPKESFLPTAAAQKVATPATV
ncbi:MAG TPA: M48 family metalloprotease [Terriglobales bacterium]|nr:M48 family metalloprotease [Terriglobales bacterium]